MKIKDIRIKSSQELRMLLNEKRDRLGVIRFDLSTTKKIKNVSEITALKKDVARILSLLNNKENKK